MGNTKVNIKAQKSSRMLSFANFKHLLLAFLLVLSMSVWYFLLRKIYLIHLTFLDSLSLLSNLRTMQHKRFILCVCAGSAWAEKRGCSFRILKSSIRMSSETVCPFTFYQDLEASTLSILTSAKNTIICLRAFTNLTIKKNSILYHLNLYSVGS